MLGFDHCGVLFGYLFPRFHVKSVFHFLFEMLRVSLSSQELLMRSATFIPRQPRKSKYDHSTPQFPKLWLVESWQSGASVAALRSRGLSYKCRLHRRPSPQTLPRGRTGESFEADHRIHKLTHEGSRPSEPLPPPHQWCQGSSLQ